MCSCGWSYVNIWHHDHVDFWIENHNKLLTNSDFQGCKLLTFCQYSLFEMKICNAFSKIYNIIHNCECKQSGSTLLSSIRQRLNVHTVNKVNECVYLINSLNIGFRKWIFVFFFISVYIFVSNSTRKQQLDPWISKTIYYNLIRDGNVVMCHWKSQTWAAEVL